MFIICHTGHRLPLQGISLAADRGYITREMTEYILLNGGDVHGTVKRSTFVGINYDDKMTQKGDDVSTL